MSQPRGVESTMNKVTEHRRLEASVSPTPRTSGRVRSVPYAFLIAWTIVLAYSYLAISHDEAWRVVAYASLTCIAVTLPSLSFSYSWASQWSMVIFVTYLGCGFRSMAVVNRGLQDAVVNRLYLRGNGLEVVDRWFWLYFLGMSLLTLGYLAAGSSARKSHRMVRRYTFASTAPLGIGCMAILGFMAFLSYASATGGLDLETLSAKRTVYVPGQAYEGSFGAQRTVNQFSAVAFWVAVAFYAKDASGKRSLLRGLVLSTLFVNAVLLPVYSSTRAQVAYTLLIALVIHFLVSGALKRSALVLATFGGTALMGLLTILRDRSQGGNENITPKTVFTSLNEGLVLNLNFTEIFKSVNIMEAVPYRMPFSYGSTFLNYLVAPIPRSVWPDKPIIDSGVGVGTAIYGTDGTSIPPGLVGEAYWAFGILGVVTGAPIFGGIIRVLTDRLLASALQDPGYAVVYGGALFTMAGTALGGSVGNALLNAALWGVTVLIGLRFCGGWERVSAVDH